MQRIKNVVAKSPSAAAGVIFYSIYYTISRVLYIAKSIIMNNADIAEMPIYLKQKNIYIYKYSKSMDLYCGNLSMINLNNY